MSEENTMPGENEILKKALESEKKLVNDLTYQLDKTRAERDLAEFRRNQLENLLSYLDASP